MGLIDPQNDLKPTTVLRLFDRRRAPRRVPWVVRAMLVLGAAGLAFFLIAYALLRP